MLNAVPTAVALRIVLVEDTETFRVLLKGELQRRLRRCEVRDYALGREALNACLEAPPDLLIADLHLPDMDGRSLIRALRLRGVGARAIVLTAHPDARLPGELVGLGVAGFVDKSSPLAQVERAVRRVLEGGMFFSAPLPAPAAARAAPEAPLSVLSPREMDVLRLVVCGLASKEVGDRLGLSPRTVEKHRAHILAKLGIRDLPTLVRWGLMNGLD
jgi:DNA-binding NarL/FixJ family response regulator